MTFEELIVRTPLAIDEERGASAVEAVGLDGAVAELVSGAAGSSPYLGDLIEREADWLAVAAKLNPKASFESVLAALDADEDDVAVSLRRAKRRVALLTALADLGGVWTLEEVTTALTRFADVAVTAALRSAIRPELDRGKLPGQSHEDLDVCGGLAVLAMGKMGAFELNYSSDIDLICLYDETRFDPDDYADARAGFVRAVRKMTKTLSERTADGYVFRTDLRLRPDASVTPVAISMEAAERYYESFGRTWERAAYIKARSAAGDLKAGNRFLKSLQPFVWRRHLDFAAIQDAHDMRLRIREHKGLHGKINAYGHDLKLGAGGIREIEFFTQTRQIIAGGRDPSLRVPTTKGGLDALVAAGWVEQADASLLKVHYTALRDAEHRVQMVADQQTHKLPTSKSEFDRVAALSGMTSSEYLTDIENRLHQVQDVIDRFFQRERPGGVSPVAALPEGAASITDRWAGYPALRSPRAVEIFERVKPHLMARLANAAQPEEALANFDAFLSGLPAGVQLFSLFEANPQLLDLVVEITDVAPDLRHYLAQNAAVFDAVIGGDFFAPWPGLDHLVGVFETELGKLDDYEAQLDLARVMAREWHFRIGVHFLREITNAEQAGRAYADLAEAITTALWPFVVAEFSKKHGPPPGRGAAVLGMGSLGARQLNAASDLDLIVIYDGAGEEFSEGRRPLATRAYYARLTQAFVTALSAPTAEGRLYEVDMRLRPSGRQGPVATSLSAFESYQKDEAWTWEHLALTRARVVAGDLSVGADTDAVREAVLKQRRDREKVLGDVAEMRARLGSAKPGEGGFDIKSGPGRRQDLELFAQTGALLMGDRGQTLDQQLKAAAAAFELDSESNSALQQASYLYWHVQAASRLLVKSEVEEAEFGAASLAFLLRQSGLSSAQELEMALSDAEREVAAIIDKYIGTASED